MSKKVIKVKIIRAYEFVKGGDCDTCNLFDYCNDIDNTDCEGGATGHYECSEEEIEQTD